MKPDRRFMDAKRMSIFVPGRRVALITLCGAALAACSTQTVTIATPGSGSRTPPPSRSLTYYNGTSWTDEQAQEAIGYIAAGIKKVYPLELRQAAAQCVLPKLIQRYPDYEDFLDTSVLAPSGSPASMDEMSKDLNQLGNCENQVGL
jgi:hypothetical protein